MHSNSFLAIARTQLVASALFLLVTLPAGAAAPTSDADAFPNYESYIKISGFAPAITGDKAAYQYRTRLPDSGGAGIEDLHVSKNPTRDTNVTLDGRALIGAENYLGKINVSKGEVASFEAGYKRFRTFYDGIGGFFPVNNTWHALKPEDLHLDRGALWAEAKMHFPERPALTLRYTNETRSGDKDSTSWGETDNVGQPYRTLNAGIVGSNNNATVRKIIPSYLHIDERHQILEANARQSFGSTAAEITLFGDWSDKHNGRFATRFPGERMLVTPTFTTITPAVGTPASEWMTFQNQVQQFTYDNQHTKTLGATATAVTTLSPQLTLRTSLQYQDVTSDFGGDRMLITDTPAGPGFPGGLPVTTTFNFRNLAGTSTVDVYAGNVALDCKVSPNLTANLALRAEDRSTRSHGGFDVLAAPNANLDLGGGVKPPTGTTVPITTRNLEASKFNEQSLTPVIDLRYSGVKSVAFYASASRRIGKGDENHTPPYNPDRDPRVAIPPAPANPLNQIISPTTFFNNLTENKGDYTIGTDWHLTPRLNVRAEVFYKDRAFHSLGYNTNNIVAGIATPAAPTLNNNYELDSQFWGGKFTALAKPTEQLSLSTRYIYQKGKMQVTGYLPTFPAYDSMDSTNHTISATLDFTPSRRFYGQANGTMVFNVVSTAYPRGGSVAAAGVIPANLFLQNLNNNYSSFQVLVGAVVTKEDDLQAQVTNYHAGNYNPALALFTQAFGASATETTATVGVKHKFRNAWIATCRLGYIDSHNDTTGGFTNFRGPLAYFAFEHAL